MKFTKMHGTGNDFVMVDGRALPQRDWARLAQAVCDRHFGIGADGLILLLPSENADLRMRMWNPDGSESEMCGNGIRCFTKLALDEGIVGRGKAEFTAETGAGVLTLRPLWQGSAVEAVEVNMGNPIFEPERVPVAATSGDFTPDASGLRWVRGHVLEAGGRSLTVACVSMGNPHAVLFADEPPDRFPLESIGPLVEHHSFFPKRVNFHVAQVLDRNRIRVRHWERGAGMTLACGTGACGAAVAARQLGLTGDRVEVEVPGGILTIEWPGSGAVLMTGPAATVYAGEWQERE
ncbi:MAG: diaminopimelate epimerase [Dehalococcoidia bacterium]|nr:diaminopimelate epimerase [Dehalococcoidia bacterium]